MYVCVCVCVSVRAHTSVRMHVLGKGVLEEGIEKCLLFLYFISPF